MEDEKREEKVIETKKGLKWYVVVIVILSLVVLGLGGYIVYDKLISKEEVKEKSNVHDVTKKDEEKDDTTVEDVIDKGENKTDIEETVTKEEVKPIVDGPISKEEAEAFLNDLVPTKVPVDLLIANSDDAIFWEAIRYLVLNKKYTKDGEQFIFQNKDIQDLAYKYYMKDSFDYISSGERIYYNSKTNTYSSPLDWGLFGTTISFEKTRNITDFNYTDNIASLTYCVKLIYDVTQHPDPANNVVTTNYFIKLVREKGVLRIREISKQ